MIITRQKKVPFSWVFLTHLPWAAMLFASAVNTVVFTLEVRKFTANPASIALLLTVTGICGMIVNPCIHFISDRVWTRWGRRKIFYVPAIALTCILVPLIPFAPSLPILLVMFVMNSLCSVVSQPKESLAQEVVPNHQRGKGSILHSIFVQTGLLAYNIALIGRFDDVLLDSPLNRWLGAIRGEFLMFWVFSAALLSVLLIVSLGIKEMRPTSIVTLRESLGGKITLWRFVKRLFIECFSGAWWPIYLLAFAQALYGMGLGSMVVLMYTDQWGYSTQDLGTNQAVVQLITVFFLGSLVSVVDRFDRLKTYGFVIIFGMSLKIFWYLFVMLLCPDNRPALWQILVIGESIGIVGHITSAVTYPLVYEYVPVDKLGTANAGLSLFRGMLGMIIGPLMGVWIAYYSTIFYPGAGSTVSAVLQQPMSREQAETLTAEWQKETGREYAATLLLPHGVRANQGPQWVFRRVDASAEKIKSEIKKREDSLRALQRQIDDALFKAAKARTPAEAAVKQAEEQTLSSEKATLTAEVRNLNSQLDEKAADFRRYLEAALAGRLADPSQAILDAGVDADGQVFLDLALMYPVNAKTIDKVNRELRLKLENAWETVKAESIERDGRFALRIRGKPKQAALSATVADLDLEVQQAVQAHAARLPMGLSAGRIGELAQSASTAIAAYRDFVAFPFPDQGYKPQTYDYFSSYILMILTDFVAIYIVWLMARLEKKGKIRRLGAMEVAGAQTKKG